MKPQKVQWSLFAIMFIAMFSVCFISCKDDEDDKKSVDNPDLIQTLKSNKWISRDASYGEGTNNHSWVDIETSFLFFTSDNSGISYWIQKDYDTDLGNSSQKDYTMFSYTVSGNTVTITDEDDYVSIYNYQGGYLVSLSGEVFYESSPMTASDYSLVRDLGPKTGSCGGNLKYSFDDRTHELTISGSGRMNDYTASNQPWHDMSISKIIIKDGCKRVGNHAFHQLKNAVWDIDLPNSLEEIGDYAFCDVSISELIVPTKLVKIGNYAFSDSKNLKEVYFAGCDYLEEIGDYAFAFCPISFSYFSLEKNVKRVGTWAFASSSFKKSFELNNVIEEIGDGAFAYMTHTMNIGKLNIPNSVKSIGTQSICGNISEIRIGTGLRTLGDNPFVGNSTGTMYVNLGNPISMESATYKYIVSNNNGNVTQNWTLYVPKGSKSVYQNAAGWKNFKSIIEDGSLTSGNGSPKYEDSQENSDNKEDKSQTKSTKSISYEINGKKFRTVLVEGPNIKPFYIMQTEIPPSCEIKTDYGVVRRLDWTKDEIIGKTEFREVLYALRDVTGMPFRLPTKEEWLYAAKGGNKSSDYVYSGGNTIDDVAWYKGNSDNKVHDVATKKANELGLYDMSGNYGEICQNESNRADDCDIDGPIYGGSWENEASDCKISSWIEGLATGKIKNTKINEKNAVECRTISVRLVYDKIE